MNRNIASPGERLSASSREINASQFLLKGLREVRVALGLSLTICHPMPNI